MKFIRQLKKSLTQSFNNLSLKYKIVVIEFCVGFLFCVIGGAVELVFKIPNIFLSILIGFLLSFFVFADLTLYVFKNMQKISVFGINFILIRDLLLVLIFLIIVFNFFKFNFVILAMGITIIPLSMAILWLLFSPF